MKPLLEFEIEAPVIGVGKKKNQLITVNNSPYWIRYHKTELKNKLKNMLCEWYIPKSELALDTFTVEFGLKRPGKKKLDSDALFFCYKWIVDTFVEQGWAKDDDKMEMRITPAELSSDGIGTRITVKFYERREQK